MLFFSFCFTMNQSNVICISCMQLLRILSSEKSSFVVEWVLHIRKCQLYNNVGCIGFNVLYTMRISELISLSILAKCLENYAIQIYFFFFLCAVKIVTCFIAVQTSLFCYIFK